MMMMMMMCTQELHEPYLVKKMLKTAVSSYRDEQEQTCDITARYRNYIKTHLLCLPSRHAPRIFTNFKTACFEF